MISDTRTALAFAMGITVGLTLWAALLCPVLWWVGWL